MITLIAGFIGGLIAGIWLAPHVYLWHAVTSGDWTRFEPKHPITWEPIEHDGCAGIPEQGVESKP